MQITSTISARKFRWNGNTGFADASELGFKPGETPGERIWNHSMDYGFILKSPRTGNELPFTYDAQVRDDEKNEVLAWKYVANTPDNRILELVIHND